MVGPQRRSSSVASSCASLEFGDLQDGQSPGKTNSLGKSPVASMTSSPQTPAGLEKSGSPSAMKKRRASIGGADDLARGLDFGTTSPSTEEKKHPFLTRGGGHKKVATPATQMSSPGKKVITPPGKEKLVAVRSTAVSSLSPRKSVEAKKDIMSPRRSVLGSEGASMNGSLISEGTSSLVEVTPKKASPRASSEGKVSAGKPSPRSNMKPIASTKGRKNSNGGTAAIDSSPPEAETKFSPAKTPDVKISSAKTPDVKISSTKTPDVKISSVKSPDVKISSVKSPDVKISSVKSPDVKISSVKSPDVKTKKSSPQSPVPSLKFRPGLTSPKSQKSAKTRQNTPSQPGRAKIRIEKAVLPENLQKPELDSFAVPVSPENEIQAQFENVVVDKMEEDGSTLLPSLMIDDNVGDEDMSSLDQGGDPGFDNDMEMPTSWLSEDLPCMFSSLSRLPEPDDSSSSHFGDPPDFLDEPFAEDTKQKSSEFANPEDVIVAAEVMPRSPVASPDEEFVASGFPSEISKEVGDSEWNYESRTFALLEDSIEAECGHGQPCEPNKPESQQPSPFPAVVEPVALSQGERMPSMVTTHPEEISGSNNGSAFTDSVAPEASLSSTVNMLTGERNLRFLSESRSIQPVSSQSDEEPAEVVTQVAAPNSLENNGGVYHFDSSREMDAPYATTVLPVEERWTDAEDEVSATQDHLVIVSSDDESSEDFIEGTCGAQLNLKQSFDAAAEPASPHNEDKGVRDVLPRDSRQDSCDSDMKPMTTVALSANGQILPEVTKEIESEFADESQDEQESGTITQTHVDKDMMIFDFEEYWTQNAGDESFHSDAGQNDAEDLQPYSMRETQLPSPVLEDEAEKSVPLNELPVSKLPGDQFINLEPEASEPLGVTQLDSHGWPRTNSSALIPASNASEMDSKSTDQEFDEVFHLFEGPDHLSAKAVSVDNLSSPEKPTIELNQGALAPTFSQFQIASEPDTSASPRYTPLETAHSNGVDIGQVNQNSDVSEDKDVELEVAEHHKSSVHTIVAQESSVADLYSPKTNLVLSNDEVRVDQKSLAEEDIDTPPISSVMTNGLLGTNIHHLDDNDLASGESVDLEGPEDPKFSPVTMQVSSQKSSFETPALADAYLSDDSSEMGPESLSVPQVLGVRAISVQTAETTDDRDATEPNELLPDASDVYPNREIASPIAGTDDYHDLVSPPVDSSKLMMVERDQNTLISSAGEEEDPLELRPPAILLPPMNETSEEEQTEAIFLLSLGRKKDLNHNEDSSTDHELQVNQSQEKPQGRDEISKDLDSDFLLGSDVISEHKEEFQDMSSESREGETRVPEHENTRILPGAMFPVEERPQEIQSQDDERIKAPALQVESYGKTVDVLEVDRQSQRPLISTPETLQDDNDTPDLVPTEHALPTGNHDESHELNVPRSPVFDQEDEIFNDKFDSKSEVESTASLNESDEGTDTLIAASGATVTDATSPSGILGKGEAICSTPEATPPTLSAGKLSNLTLNEADEFDDKLGSEDTVDGERWRIVSDFGEQSSTTEHGWEEPLVSTDSSGSKSSTKNLFRQESMVTHAGNSVVADDANDLEIDMDISEEASRTILTPVSTPNGSIDYHDPDFQEIHLPLGKSISADDQVSRSEHFLETQKVLVASSDASVDDSDDVKGVEIVPEYSAEHFSSKDLPFEQFVASNQQVSNAAISDVDEDSELTRFEEAENLKETLEPIPLLTDEDMVVESPTQSFIHSSQDSAKNMHVEEREGTSAPQLTLPPEMNIADTFAPENILWSSPEQHSTEETVLKDEETVVYSPKNSFVSSGTPDTTILADIDGETHSHVSLTASKEEESFNRNLEESLLNDELVHCPKDRIHCAAQDLNTTFSGSHGIQAVSWKDENEASSLVEKPLHGDEDTAVAGSKKFSVISGEDTAVSDVDELEEKSWKGGKEEEKSLNGSPERGEETMVVVSKDQVVSNPTSQSNIPAKETPEISTLDVHHIQNHSGHLWSGESFNGSLKGEPLLEDEDTVVYRPTVGEFIMEESSPKGVENVVDSHMQILNAPEDTVANGHTAEESLMEGSTYAGKAVDSPAETSNVPKDTVVCRPSVGDSTPELMEKSSIEGVEPVVDRHMEVFNVPEHDATNAALMVVEEQETQRDDKERESLNGNLERESNIEVEKNSEESFVAPDLLNANYTSNLVEPEESEKQTDKEETLNQRLEEKSSSEVEQPVVERSKESFVSPDRQTATNTSNVAVAELEEQTDKEEETLDQSLDSGSPLEVEETEVESSEKESFVAPDLVKAKDISNLAAAEKLEEHSDEEEESVDQFLDTKSTFEVEEPVVESSEKESFVAPDVIDAKSTSHLFIADELEKQTDKEEETLDRSLGEKSMYEAEETIVESSEKESYVAPGLLDANYSSNFVVTDQLEKQTDKEKEALGQSPEVKSTVEVEQTMKDGTIQTFVAPDQLNVKSSSMIVADELEKQTDKEEENLEEKSTLEVADIVVERSKESLVVSDAAAETFDAEDLDKHPTQKTPSKEGESLNATNLEEESIQDTVVDSSSDNVKKELEYLSEEDDATQSLSGPTNFGANLVVSNLNLTDEGAKEPHSSPIADDVNSDSVNNSLNVSEVVQKDTVAKYSEEFSKAPAAEEESCMTNGEKFSKTPAVEEESCMTNEEEFSKAPAVEEESCMTNGEEFSKAPAAKEESCMTNGEEFSKAPAAEEESCMTNGEEFSKAPAAEEESCMTNGEKFSKAPAAEEESCMTNGEKFSKVPAAEKESCMTNGEEFSKVPAAEEESCMTNGEEFSKVPAAEEESCMTNGVKLKDSNAPVHETEDKDGITVPTNPQADTTPESTEPQSPTATLYPLSKPPFSGSLQDRLWEEQAEAYNSGQGTPSRNGDHATQASGVSSSPKENPTSSEDQIQPVAAAANGNHAVVVGTTNGAGSHENGSTPVQDQPKGNGKEKLHTPLRSLLLEESSHAGSLTPNGVNSSPSFIRRLFRVMSTSRSVEKEASQGKLKRSSSMWVSCLGSPQVQQ